jgi:hypothetical protein
MFQFVAVFGVPGVSGWFAFLECSELVRHSLWKGKSAWGKREKSCSWRLFVRFLGSR